MKNKTEMDTAFNDLSKVHDKSVEYRDGLTTEFEKLRANLDNLEDMDDSDTADAIRASIEQKLNLTKSQLEEAIKKEQDIRFRREEVEESKKEIDSLANSLSMINELKDPDDKSVDSAEEPTAQPEAVDNRSEISEGVAGENSSEQMETSSEDIEVLLEDVNEQNDMAVSPIDIAEANQRVSEKELFFV